LLPFDVICVMRGRSPLPRNIIERLPNLKLIASTGAGNASVDVAAAGDRGIAVVHTGYRSDAAIEFTSALILASTRHVVTESNSVRSGGWQQTVGADLRGKTLGVLGRVCTSPQQIWLSQGMPLTTTSIFISRSQTPETRRDWIAALDTIESLKPHTVIAGHKKPEKKDSPRIIEETRQYFRDFDRLAGVTTTARELYDEMLRLYPTRANPGSLWGSARAAKP
jgi:hypothetical protein